MTPVWVATRPDGVTGLFRSGRAVRSEDEMPKKKVVNVMVCSDPATLGNDAVEQDVYTYSNNLAKLLEHEFGCVVHIHLDSDSNSTADDQSVRERIREIESTDEWRKLLP